MQVELCKSIVDTLLLDDGAGGLVELTGHSDSDIKIARDRPPRKAETAFLGILVFQSIPLMESDVSHLQRARVQFKAYSSHEIVAIKICDRLEVLLHAKNEENASGCNRAYLDFSTDEISNRETRYKNRTYPDFDSDLDVWSQIVDADVIWVNQPCGN